jgi:hypothetical protein
MSIGRRRTSTSSISLSLREPILPPHHLHRQILISFIPPQKSHANELSSSGSTQLPRPLMLQYPNPLSRSLTPPRHLPIPVIAPSMFPYQARVSPSVRMALSALPTETKQFHLPLQILQLPPLRSPYPSSLPPNQSPLLSTSLLPERSPLSPSLLLQLHRLLPIFIETPSLESSTSLLSSILTLPTLRVSQSS